MHLVALSMCHINIFKDLTQQTTNIVFWHQSHVIIIVRYLDTHTNSGVSDISILQRQERSNRISDESTPTLLTPSKYVIRRTGALRTQIKCSVTMNMSGKLLRD